MEVQSDLYVLCQLLINLLKTYLWILSPGTILHTSDLAVKQDG